MVRLSKDPDVPSDLRDALDNAAGERASPEVLARVLAATAAGAGVAALAAHGATRTSHVLFGSSMAVKGAVAVAIFAAGATLGGLAVHDHDVRRSAPLAQEVVPARVDVSVRPLSPAPRAAVGMPAAPSSVAVVVPPSANAAPPAPPPSGAERSTSPPHAQASRVAAVPAPAVSDAPPVVAAVTTAPSVRDSSTHDELESLRAIRTALDASRPKEALTAIADHRAKFPKTLFGQELLLLEAEAHWAGRDASTCALLDRFTTDYPRSLLIRRVDALLLEARCGADAGAGGGIPSQ